MKKPQNGLKKRSRPALSGAKEGRPVEVFNPKRPFVFPKEFIFSRRAPVGQSEQTECESETLKP